MITLATWNVNSLKVRLPQVLDWLIANPVEVLCLQEIKLIDNQFPIDAFNLAGYRSIFTGQKAYNGVAILTSIHQLPVYDIQYNLPNFKDDQKRLIAATLSDGTRVICAYFPNGQSLNSDKYQYKLLWIDALIAYIATQIKQYPRLVLSGDYNIAPEDTDVYDPPLWQNQLHCSIPERQRFQQLLNLGLVDAYRCFEQPVNHYTWWDYRLLGFQKNKGLRIDHCLVSQAIRPYLRYCTIDRLPRKNKQPSDHAPVLVSF